MNRLVSRFLTLCLVVTVVVSSAQISVHPNPAERKVTLSIYSDKEETIYYEIMDVACKKSITLHPYRLNKGNNHIALNVASLPADSYSVRIFGKSYSEIIKFNKP